MAESGDTLALKISNSSTGEFITEVQLAPSAKVEELGPLVAAALGTSTWTEFRFLHGSDALEKSQALGSIQPEAKEVELSVLKLPRLSIRCPSSIQAAAALPCQDLLIVTSGNASSTKAEELTVVGKDLGVRSPHWIWRAKAVDGWSLDSATLLARMWPCLHPENLTALLEHQELLPGEVLTESEKEEFRQTGKAEFWPSKWEECNHMSVSVYDDTWAVLAWNQNDYLGGTGAVQRLNLQTGEIVHWGNFYDLWDVVAEPTTGRLFVTSCYDGQDIVAFPDECCLTEGEPKEAAPQQKIIKSQAAGMGYGLCYDASLGVLVATSQERLASFFVVGPPGALSLELAKSAPNATVEESIRPDGSDYTPGDKTQPWETVRIPIPDGVPAQYAHSSLSCTGGVVTYLAKEGKELRIAKLLGPGSAEIEVIPCADHERIHAFVQLPNGLTVLFLQPAPAEGS